MIKLVSIPGSHRICEYFLFLCLVSSMVICLCGCEQSIMMTLDSVAPQLVIEGTITNTDNAVLVHISQSQDYYNQSKFQNISKANVVLSFGSTNLKLTEKTAGYYYHNNIPKIPGMSYSLKVTTGGSTYSSSVILPPVVPVDSIYFRPAIFEPDSLNCYIRFKDPVAYENYYRIRIFRNRRFAVNDYFLYNDDFSNGQNMTTPIYYRYFAPGDTVVVELLNLEKSTYHYLKGISEIVGETMTTQVPGNPPSNFSGGVLGYFGAWGTFTTLVVVPGTKSSPPLR